MIRPVDGLAQWGLRTFFQRYPAKRRAQLASLGRRYGRAPSLASPGRAVYDGRGEGESACELRFSFPDGPFPSARATVSVLGAGHVRVWASRDGTPALRSTWAVCGPAGDTPVEGRRRDDYSVFERPAFSVEVSAADDSLHLELPGLKLDIFLEPFRIEWRAPDGRLLAADAPEGAFSFGLSGGPEARPRPDGRPVPPGLHAARHAMAKSRSRFHGFGEKSGRLNKDGRRLVMMDLDSMGYDAERADPLYKHVPFYLAMGSPGEPAYGLFYDNFAVSEFDLGRARGDRLLWTADSGDVDCHFLAGPTPREVVMRLALLTGKPCLPPRWSLGYGGSTMGYTEAPDAQARLEGFLDLCDAGGWPCDLFHLSSGYTTGGDGKRYVFEWNRSRVPDPEGLFSRYAKQRVHISANVKPALLTTHPRYGELAASGLFVKGPDGRPFVAPFWGGRGSWLDFTNPAARAWWKARLSESLLSRGADSSWNDNNEFEAWDEACVADRFGDPGPIAGLRPLLSLHMARASREAQLDHAPDRRPFVLTRAACAGSQRYAQTWTGDNYASWRNLRYNVPMGLGLSLSGLPNFGHDAGGFSGFRVGKELFVRWVQNAALHPRFCIHSWHFDGSVNEPWMHPSVAAELREAFALRYRLLPYLYSLLVHASMTGEPILRPMFYEFPEDGLLAGESFDFLLGPSLLVASVLRRGERRRKLRLPAGSEWIDFHTGERHSGGPDGATAILDAPLSRLPLLARAPSVIPMGKALTRATVEGDTLRELHLFPATGEAQVSFTLHEDDGESGRRGPGERLALTAWLGSTSTSLEIRVDLEGAWKPAWRELALVLPRGEERPLRWKGATLATTRDGEGRRRVCISPWD